MSVTKEILASQARLTLLRGVTINLSTLTVNTIDVSTGTIVETVSTVTVTDPTSVTEKVCLTSVERDSILVLQEKALSALKATMSSITSVVAVIEKVREGELTTGTATSASVFISDVITVLTSALMGVSIEGSVSSVTSVTNIAVSTLSEDQKTLLTEIGNT